MKSLKIALIQFSYHLVANKHQKVLSAVKLNSLQHGGLYIYADECSSVQLIMSTDIVDYNKIFAYIL